MKIHLVSDLHNEFSPYPFKQPLGVDVVIAAGDIACNGKGPLFLRESFGQFVPIIYVAGNHEFYNGSICEGTEELKKECERLDVTFLNGGFNSCEIEGVVFIGGTLWTDYKLWGDDLRQVCKSVARDYMNDFRKIRYQKEPWIRFTPDEAEKLHYETLWAIERNLLKNKGKKCVVVTHMAPHPESVDTPYSNKFDLDGRLSASYASNLEEFIVKHEPVLWVHGHMHNSFDYVVGKTRIVCNPRGYSRPTRPETQENEKFNKDLIIGI